MVRVHAAATAAATLRTSKERLQRHGLAEVKQEHIAHHSDPLKDFGSGGHKWYTLAGASGSKSNRWFGLLRRVLTTRTQEEVPEMKPLPLDGGAHLEADVMASVRRPPTREIQAADDELINAWGAALRAEGYAEASIDRASKRLRSFARRLPNGLIKATQGDVVTFYREREGIARQRLAARGEALRPARVVYARHPGWTSFVACIKQFYAWAERRGLMCQAMNPLRGIRQYPVARTDVAVRPEWYCRMLNNLSLSYRETALLWLLGHGLTPGEVLRLAPRDVDLEGRMVHVRGTRCPRVVPLSDRAVVRLRPWVTDKQWSGRQWLFPSGYRRPISDRTLRDIVQRVAARVFSAPSETSIRSGIYPLGFRHTFVVLALRRRVPVDCLMGLTGIGRAKLLTTYLSQTAPPERIRAEFRRLVSRCGDWL